MPYALKPGPKAPQKVNPLDELKIGKNTDVFESDTDIIEVVQRGMDLDIEEISPPQMSRPLLAKLSETLRLSCISAGVKAGYDLSKVLRNFEAQIQAEELQTSTQQRLDGWFGVGAASL
jgi:hypothetical protein